MTISVFQPESGFGYQNWAETDSICYQRGAYGPELMVLVRPAGQIRVWICMAKLYRSRVWFVDVVFVSIVN